MKPQLIIVLLSLLSFSLFAEEKVTLKIKTPKISIIKEIDHKGKNLKIKSLNSALYCVAYYKKSYNPFKYLANAILGIDGYETSDIQTHFVTEKKTSKLSLEETNSGINVKGTLKASKLNKSWNLEWVSYCIYKVFANITIDHKESQIEIFNYKNEYSQSFQEDLATEIEKSESLTIMK